MQMAFVFILKMFQDM